jgi:hypothetical protein
VIRRTSCSANNEQNKQTNKSKQNKTKKQQLHSRKYELFTESHQLTLVPHYLCSQSLFSSFTAVSRRCSSHPRYFTPSIFDPSTTTMTTTTASKQRRQSARSCNCIGASQRFLREGKGEVKRGRYGEAGRKGKRHRTSANERSGRLQIHHKQLGRKNGRVVGRTAPLLCPVSIRRFALLCRHGDGFFTRPPSQTDACATPAAAAASGRMMQFRRRFFNAVGSGDHARGVRSKTHRIGGERAKR